jgi:hypothetical protein
MESFLDEIKKIETILNKTGTKTFGIYRSYLTFKTKRFEDSIKQLKDVENLKTKMIEGTPIVPMKITDHKALYALWYTKNKLPKESRTLSLEEVEPLTLDN